MRNYNSCIFFRSWKLTTLKMRCWSIFFVNTGEVTHIPGRRRGTQAGNQCPLLKNFSPSQQWKLKGETNVLLLFLKLFVCLFVWLYCPLPFMVIFGQSHGRPLKTIDECCYFNLNMNSTRHELSN